MTRKTLIALLLAALPIAHATAGTVDFSDRAVMRGWHGGAADAYAAYVGNRWQPITIQLDTAPLPTSQASGLAGSRRVASASALYNWTQAHPVGAVPTSGQFAYGWGRGQHGYLANDDREDYGVPAWHGHGPGHGHGGGSDDGGGVPAVPLPAGFPLLLSALALLSFALRGAARD